LTVIRDGEQLGLGRHATGQLGQRTIQPDSNCWIPRCGTGKIPYPVHLHILQMLQFNY